MSWPRRIFRSRVVGFSLVAVMLIHHWSFWLLLSMERDLPLLTILNRWDAEHYTTIAQEGQHGALWAFFPLYPAVARGLFVILGSAIPPAALGCIASTTTLLIFVFLSTRAQANHTSQSLRPSPWGMFLILYGPASYVLHTHHTESVFLLLSFLALSSAIRGEGLTAGLFAGLTIWTKIQGALIAFFVLVLLFSQVKQLRLRQVLLSLVLMGTLGCAFLAFEWVVAGSPFAFLEAQSNWTHASSVIDVVRALWLGNPWQNTSSGSIHRHIWFFGCIALAIAYLKSDRYFGGYTLAALFPMFLQAEFINVFRFGAVLFPLWFWVGRNLERRPRWLQAVIAITLIALNHITTKRYALGQWAY